MDYERLAAELLRALRGKRSQAAFARRLGCRGNAIYTWEAGRNFPTAARTFQAAKRSGIDGLAALQRFYVRPPAWLHGCNPSQPQTLARLLDDLRGKTPVQTIADSIGRSRFAVSRWLKGQTQPRLPDFLRLIEATSLRLLDFIACLVDPAGLPSIAEPWRDLEATRRAAYDVPWSQAFLRALELEDYRALPAHVPGWLAGQLGLSIDEETQSLALLEHSGQIRMQRGRYRPARVTTVDTRADADAARRLRVFYSRVASDRIEHDTRASSAYNLFGVSHADLTRLRELQRAYFREMRTIIAQSQPVEVIALANLQLIELSSEGTS
jgi:transcriptional regulator with XRE-family HTH domain